ncbi:Si-specific NAD(P)(+) transhydrogenase [bacterium]|nr:Si-specific NAD(P)(+) transhydrogenase [bacterium]
MPSQRQYDMVVIGSGPSGQRAAVQAAKLKKKVLVVERDWIGGSCLHTGTIPSKTLREAALEFSAEHPSVFDQVMTRKQAVIDAEAAVIQKQLQRNGVEFVQGRASFKSASSVWVETPTARVEVSAQFIVIATGTRPARAADIPFDDIAIFDSDTILHLRRKPHTMAVLGAGVIGCEYASIFARMGIRVTLVDQRDRLLSWMDSEITAALQKQFSECGIELCLAAKTTNIHRTADGKARLHIGENERTFDALLICMGRLGNTDSLHLTAAGLVANERGLLNVNEHYQTAVPHIYAVGDVIGSPGLASASSEQGRLAAAHAFAVRGGSFPDAFPYGIYTIPEISSVGAQESDLQKRGIAYVVGRAQYKELARGKILGDEHGFLKLLFDSKTRRVLGVQVIGSGATELVHIGQAAFILGAGIDFFINNVFNYPTLAEAYKVAAYNAYNQLPAA